MYLSLNCNCYKVLCILFIPQVYSETVGCLKHCGSVRTSQSARTSPQSTTSHKYRASERIDEMNLREITEVMDVLGVTDKWVENLSDARERIRTALAQLHEKTFNWSPRKVRCLSVKFQNRNEFDRGSLSFKKERHSVIAMKPCS